MHDCLQTGKPPRYETSQLGQLSLLASVEAASLGGHEAQVDWHGPKVDDSPAFVLTLVK